MKMSFPPLNINDHPKGAIWEDLSSYRIEDHKKDYYFLEDTWKYLGRFFSILDALEQMPPISSDNDSDI